MVQVQYVQCACRVPPFACMVSKCVEKTGLHTSIQSYDSPPCHTQQRGHLPLVALWITVALPFCIEKFTKNSLGPRRSDFLQRSPPRPASTSETQKSFPDPSNPSASRLQKVKDSFSFCHSQPSRLSTQLPIPGSLCYIIRPSQIIELLRG